MDLSLHTLLRRIDVISCKFVDVKEPFLYVVPRKTENITFVRLKMRMQGDLRAVISCCRDTILSPYLVHKRSLRIRASKHKDHHTQVSPSELDEAFAQARQAAAIGGTNPVTFHEIRSLGADLYRQAGWTLARIEQFLGHGSEQMTLHYLKGHEAPWQEVEAGLQLP